MTPWDADSQSRSCSYRRLGRITATRPCHHHAMIAPQRKGTRAAVTSAPGADHGGVRVASQPVSVTIADTCGPAMPTRRDRSGTRSGRWRWRPTGGPGCARGATLAGYSAQMSRIVGAPVLLSALGSALFGVVQIVHRCLCCPWWMLRLYPQRPEPTNSLKRSNLC
jgi:hypothetical protein